MKSRTLGIVLLILMTSCRQEPSCQDEMILILEQHSKEPYRHRNQLYPQAKIPYIDSLLMITETMSSETNLCKCFKAHMLMELGQKEEAIKILDGGFSPFSDDVSTTRDTVFSKIKARIRDTVLAEKKLQITMN